MKRIRLEPEAYRQGHCFSVTLATAERGPALTHPNAIQICMTALKEAAEKCEASVYAYCFMPDHLHLLATTPDRVNFTDFIRQFKQLSAYRLRRQIQTGRPLWQTRFYDHALRSDEGVVTAARYIFDNPVRAGMVASAADYPYSGSLVWKSVLSSSGSEDPDLHSARRRVALAARNDPPESRDRNTHRQAMQRKRDRKEVGPWT